MFLPSAVLQTASAQVKQLTSLLCKGRNPLPRSQPYLSVSGLLPPGLKQTNKKMKGLAKEAGGG